MTDMIEPFTYLENQDGVAFVSGCVADTHGDLMLTVMRNHSKLFVRDTKNLPEFVHHRLGAVVNVQDEEWADFCRKKSNGAIFEKKLHFSNDPDWKVIYPSDVVTYDYGGSPLKFEEYLYRVSRWFCDADGVSVVLGKSTRGGWYFIADDANLEDEYPPIFASNNVLDAVALLLLSYSECP